MHITLCFGCKGGNLVNKTTQQSISSTLSSIAPRYDIEKIYLFGSCARGEETEQSDIDLCVESGPTFSLFTAGSFVDDLESALNRSIDLVTERMLYAHVKAGMQQDRVLVYERT